MKKLIATMAFAFAVLQAPANAAVLVTSVGVGDPGNVAAAVPGSTYITFEDVAVNTVGSFTSNGFSFTGQGGVTNTSASFPFTYTQPKADNTHYLAIGFDIVPIIWPGPRATTLSLESDYTKFGFYWGSIDSYNSVTFFNDGVQVFSLSGGGVPGANPSANNSNAATRNRYVNFDFSGGSMFDQVVFSTTFRTFEVDNLALAGHAPELSTWAMMLVGFAGVGFVAYRRSRRAAAAATI
jgi:hypothetical protein